MSRKDTIIIAVLVNAGLLAVLFATAWHGEEDRVIDRVEVAQAAPTSTAPTADATVVAAAAPKDEIDQVLQRYTTTQQANGAPVVDANAPSAAPVDVTAAAPVVVEAAPQPAPAVAEFVDVTVKRGDALAKIARANGTTVEKIMAANNLVNSNLKIGQVLKVPKGSSSAAAEAKPKAAATKEIASADIAYYSVQPGDNPWTIARKHQVRLEDLLKLNNLNEESARNLKVGDKLRVR